MFFVTRPRGRVNVMCSLLQDDMEGVDSAFLLQVAIQRLLLCVNYVTSHHSMVNVVYFILHRVV